MGPGENTDIDGSSLLYNEYIVYKIEQIRIRYLLRVNFNYKNWIELIKINFFVSYIMRVKMDSQIK